MATRRSLAVDLASLLVAFDDATLESATYLDLRSGEIITLSGDVQREIEALYEDTFAPRFLNEQREEEATLVAALARRASVATRGGARNLAR